jgi:hypothetical protein
VKSYQALYLEYANIEERYPTVECQQVVVSRAKSLCGCQPARDSRCAALESTLELTGYGGLVLDLQHFNCTNIVWRRVDDLPVMRNATLSLELLSLFSTFCRYSCVLQDKPFSQDRPFLSISIFNVLRCGLSLIDTAAKLTLIIHSNRYATSNMAKCRPRFGTSPSTHFSTMLRPQRRFGSRSTVHIQYQTFNNEKVGS